MAAKLPSKNPKFAFYTFLGMWANNLLHGTRMGLELGHKILNWVCSGQGGCCVATQPLAWVVRPHGGHTVHYYSNCYSAWGHV